MAKDGDPEMLAGPGSRNGSIAGECAWHATRAVVHCGSIAGDLYGVALPLQWCSLWSELTAPVRLSCLRCEWNAVSCEAVPLQVLRLIRVWAQVITSGRLNEGGAAQVRAHSFFIARVRARPVQVTHVSRMRFANAFRECFAARAGDGAARRTGAWPRLSLTLVTAAVVEFRGSCC